MKLAIAFLISFATLVEAKEANRYSVITLVNETPFRIFYSYAWGPGTDEWKNSIEPFGYYVHWWKFDYPNQDWAPWFYLRMDGDEGWHKLGSFFSPNTDSNRGRVYIFVDEGEGRVRDIKLQEKLYTE